MTNGNLFYIIATIFSALFGILFLIWGLYQIKTGKMVAKNAKNPIDEPREVGVLFLFLGLFGIFLAMIILSESLKDSAILKTIGFVGETLSVILFAFVTLFSATLGLIKKRIYTVKTSVKTKKLIKKFYLPVNISQICFIGLMTAAFVLDVKFAGWLAFAAIISLFVNCFCLIEISIKSVKNR